MFFRIFPKINLWQIGLDFEPFERQYNLFDTYPLKNLRIV